MPVPATRKGVQKHYDARPKEIKTYFDHLPALLVSFPLDVVISYIFAQIELAHNMTLYCGVVKRHRANPTIARNVIDSHHMTRSGFQERFEVVFGKPISAAIIANLADAENVRDKIMHGKSVLEREKREAIYKALTYAEELNGEVTALASFKPFGPLRGFKGRAKPLDKATSRWVLKGMGFNVA